MSAYNSFLIKHFYDKNDNSKAVVCKVTGIIPTKDNKGSLYVFNNEAHVALNDRETVKNFFINILKNGYCNGIPQEIGSVDDRTITSFMIDLRNINEYENFANDVVIAYNEAKNTFEEEHKSIFAKNFELTTAVISIIKHVKSDYSEKLGDAQIIYFDVYSSGYCDGYLTMALEDKKYPFIDFVKMTGFSSSEDLKVAGSVINGINAGFIKPAPFTLGPIVFNPIGNDSVDLDSSGMIINYIGLLRNNPTNFKEFRIYATLKFSPKTQDGKFIGRSQEAYDKFVEFIKLTNEQSKTGKELSETIYLPFLFESAKIEVQGTNPDNIKAVDIATILYKAFINLTIENFEALSNDSIIDPSNINIESDNVCTVKFKTENSVYLTPIFTNSHIK